MLQTSYSSEIDIEDISDYCIPEFVKDKNFESFSKLFLEIIGYAHCFCNLKIRENQNAILVIAHNLFSFDFFFVVKGIRPCA